MGTTCAACHCTDIEKGTLPCRDACKNATWPPGALGRGSHVDSSEGAGAAGAATPPKAAAGRGRGASKDPLAPARRPSKVKTGAAAGSLDTDDPSRKPSKESKEGGEASKRGDGGGSTEKPPPPPRKGSKETAKGSGIARRRLSNFEETRRAEQEQKTDEDRGPIEEPGTPDRARKASKEPGQRPTAVEVAWNLKEQILEGHQARGPPSKVSKAKSLGGGTTSTKSSDGEEIWTVSSRQGSKDAVGKSLRERRLQKPLTVDTVDVPRQISKDADGGTGVVAL